MADTQPRAPKLSDSDLRAFLRADSDRSITQSKTLLKPQALLAVFAPSPASLQGKGKISKSGDSQGSPFALGICTNEVADYFPLLLWFIMLHKPSLHESLGR